VKSFRNTKSNITNIVQHAELFVALNLKPAGFDSLLKVVNRVSWDKTFPHN